MEPSFLSKPDFVVGIPVERVKSRFAFVIPKALFHEKESPGIPVDVFFWHIDIVNILLVLICIEFRLNIFAKILYFLDFTKLNMRFTQFLTVE